MKVRSTYTGFLGVAGVPVFVHKGDEFDLNDKVVQAHPHQFVEILEAPTPEPPALVEPPAPAKRPRQSKQRSGADE